MDADSSVHNKNSTSEYANHSDEPDTIKPFDFLLSSLLCLAKQKKLHASKAALLSGLPLTQECLTPDLVDRAVARIGLKAKVIERILGDISSIVLPCVILLKGNRSAVLLSLDKTLDECVVIEGSNETSQKKSISELTQDYTGHAILFSEVPHFDNHLNSPRPERSFAWLRNVLSYSAKIYRDVLLASLFINIFVVANPLFVMNVYDRVVPNNAFETLWALAVGILVLYGFDFALRSLRSYFVELAGKKTDVLLSTQIFERVLGARYAVHPKSVGAFVSQLKDFDAVRSFISSSTILAFIDFPFVIIFLLVIAYIGGPMVWVPLSLMPIVFGYAYICHVRLKPTVEKNLQASSQKNSTLVESLSNLETLKSIGGEGKVLNKWDMAVGQNALWGMKARVISASATSFASFAQQLSTVLVVIVGVYSIAENELSQGALIACVILSGRVLTPLVQISGLMVQYYQSKMALESIDALYQQPQERPAQSRFIQTPIINGAVHIRNLNFTYPDETLPSLQDLNVAIKQGEKIAIIGKIGSGKSSLQKLLLGLYQPDSGNIHFDSNEISQIDPADLRSKIAYSPQTSSLFYGSIRDNILYGQNELGDEALLSASKAAGVSLWVDSHPQVYEREVGEQGQNLSGGQNQSIVLARALVADKPIVILDEPTAAMDNASEAHVVRELKPRLENKTLILVTHKVALLALVDRLIVMDRGRIIADGKKAAVLEALKKGQLNVT